MILLVLGLALWWASHLVKVVAPARRAAAVARMGEGPWKGLISLVTLVAIALMVIGFRAAEDDPVILWTAPLWLWHLNNALMAVAVVVFTAGFFASPVRRRIGNPQLTGVKIWAVAHLAVNGDLASLILFGGLLAWAVVAVIGTKRRDSPRGHVPDSSMGGLAAHLVASAVLYGVIIGIHSWLGVSPFPA
jgi:uncharacterized membrane protein